MSYFEPKFGGVIADYRLDCPMKQKSINFYVEGVPLSEDEDAAFQQLTILLPRGLPYGIRIRVWQDFFRDIVMPSEIMVGYSVTDELGGSVEIVQPLETFVMADVPWADIIA